MCSPGFGCSARIRARTSDWSRSGLAPVRVALCGPALAIGREPGGPAFVVADEWELVETGDRIGVTSLRPRAQSFIRTPIAVRGTIAGGGVVPDTVATKE